MRPASGWIGLIREGDGMVSVFEDFFFFVGFLPNTPEQIQPTAAARREEG